MTGKSVQRTFQRNIAGALNCPDITTFESFRYLGVIVVSVIAAVVVVIVVRVNFKFSVRVGI